MWYFIQRLLLIPLGFSLCLLTTMMVLASLSFERLTEAMTQAGPHSWTPMYTFTLQAFVLATPISLVPMLLMILIGEIARIRSVLFYVAGGGLAFGCLPILRHLDLSMLYALERSASDPGDAFVWQVLATAGFAGGFVYWIIAGRTV